MCRDSGGPLYVKHGLPPCPELYPPLLPPPAQVIAESQPGQGNEARPFYDFLESCLRHKSEIVIFEAARAICNMRCVRHGGWGWAWWEWQQRWRGAKGQLSG